MAKELGFKPLLLIKNIPNKNQQWKEPVKQWIHRLYAKRFGSLASNNKLPRENQQQRSPDLKKDVDQPLKSISRGDNDDSLPF